MWKFFLGLATLFLATAVIGPIASLTEPKLQDTPVGLFVAICLGLWVAATILSSSLSLTETVPMVGIRTVYFTGIASLTLTLQPLNDGVQKGFTSRHFLAMAAFLVVGAIFSIVGYRLKPKD